MQEPVAYSNTLFVSYNIDNVTGGGGGVDAIAILQVLKNIPVLAIHDHRQVRCQQAGNDVIQVRVRVRLILQQVTRNCCICIVGRRQSCRPSAKVLPMLCDNMMVLHQSIIFRKYPVVAQCSDLSKSRNGRYTGCLYSEYSVS
ncbi:MAG: hypothetical protein R2847_01925 [Bacteroidia bacterium]